ncbi:hypothetical protein ABPG72_013998 [Tetrahymena utriculariae]
MQNIFDSTFRDILIKYDIFNNVVFISTDGAATMLSDKNGVVGLITQDLPWTMSIHYSAHLASLGFNDIYQEYEEIQEPNKIIFKLSKQFNSKKLSSFQILKKKQEEELKLEEHLDTNYIYKEIKAQKLKQPFDVRWLSYYPCIEKIFEMFRPLINAQMKCDSEKSKYYYQK